jgi:hypothetical protein
MEIDRNIEPQTRWQGNEDSPIVVVLNHYPRDNGRDDFTEQEGWPDPTAVTNLNLRFLLCEAAGLRVPPVPDPGERAACGNKKGYGTDGILYFTNAISHLVPTKECGRVHRQYEGVKRLMGSRIDHKNVIIASGDLAYKVVCKAFNVKFEKYGCEERAIPNETRTCTLFHLRHPSYVMPIERHWQDWAGIGKHVREHLADWYQEKYVPWLNSPLHASAHRGKDVRLS